MEEKTVDRVGVVASTLCALHCAAGAVIVGVAGAGAAGAVPLLSDERYEMVFAAVAVALAAFALANGYRRHRSTTPAAVGAVGVALVAASRFLELGIPYAEPVLSVSGALLLVVAHILNLRAYRAKRC